MKLNDKEELVCVKSIYHFKEGERYKFRFDNPDAIYVYYPSHISIKINKFGVKFSTDTMIWGINFYKFYFCDIREHRKMKLEKINNYDRV